MYTAVIEFSLMPKALESAFSYWTFNDMNDLG